MFSSATKTVTNSSQRLSRKNRNIFYWSMLALPLLQFVIFYVVVNFNSIFMAFQEYNTFTFKNTWNLNNFKYWFSDAWLPKLGYCLKNSLLYFGITLITIPISTIISYYIYKKFFLSQFFKVIAFIPSIISISAFVIMYKYFVNAGLHDLFKSSPISAVQSPYRQPLLIAFYILLNMSGNLLLYINAMSQVSPSVAEAARIDGASEFKVFLHVFVPQIWGTIVSLLIIFMAGIVINQAYLFTFYGANADPELQTFGYFIFSNIQDGAPGVSNLTEAYHRVSAFGLVCTLIVAPLTILSRNLLLKFGPRED